MKYLVFNLIKRIFSFTFLVVILFYLSSCKTKNESGLKIINVNDIESFNDARISGSVHLTYDQIPIQTKNWNKDDELIVYCTNYFCTESDRVAKSLKNNGFVNVKVYRGGIQEWYQLSLKDNKSYPFQGAAKQAFLHKPIVKTEAENGEISIVDAQELSKNLAKAKK